jgi:hypothetical protein
VSPPSDRSTGPTVTPQSTATAEESLAPWARVFLPVLAQVFCLLQLHVLTDHNSKPTSAAIFLAGSSAQDSPSKILQVPSPSVSPSAGPSVPPVPLTSAAAEGYRAGLSKLWPRMQSVLPSTQTKALLSAAPARLLPWLPSWLSNFAK